MEWKLLRNLIAFWIFGICTDFAYIVMLSGAEDIINKYNNKNSTALDYCEPVTLNTASKTQKYDEGLQDKLESRRCTPVPTSAVLLADVIPTILIKLTIPFYVERAPIDVRHMIIVVTQFMAYFFVAFSPNIQMALTGVVLASISSGLGEVSYISFTSYFGSSAVSTWASGTGGANLFGSLSYAGLTEPHFAGLSARTTLLIMICVPVILALAYSYLLVMPKDIYRIKLYDPRTWIVPQWYLDGEKKGGMKPSIPGTSPENGFKEEPAKDVESTAEKNPESQKDFYVPQKQLSFNEKLRVALPLLKYMVPLTTVYFAEYLMNQGLVELIIYDCAHGFNLSETSQYRWYQVLYQAGVFISRSTSSFYKVPKWVLFAFPILQLMNASFFFANAVYYFVPHIGIAFTLILLEGLIGGSSYVHTFKYIYAHAEPEIREVSMAIASFGDAFGIVVAGFVAIPVHNYICRQPFR